MTARRCWLVFAALLPLFSSHALADVYFGAIPDLPGGSHPSISGLSSDGTAAAGSSWKYDHREATRWTAEGGTEGLGVLSWDNPLSIAFGISGDGQTVVGYANSAHPYEAFRWTPATGMVGLGVLPGGNISGAWDASGDGAVIVGFGDTPTSTMQAFRWTATDGMVALPGLPGSTGTSNAASISIDGKMIVGYAVHTTTSEACRWSDGGIAGLGVLPGGTGSSYASAVSADGAVIVGASASAATAPDDYEMFRWTAESGMVGLGDLPGGKYYSEALDVSADGAVIVGMSESGRDLEACIWDAEHGLRSMYDVLTIECGLNLNGWTLSTAGGVSADGLTVVGSGLDPTGEPTTWIARLPEPATIWLIALGALIRRRR